MQGVVFVWFFCNTLGFTLGIRERARGHPQAASYTVETGLLLCIILVLEGILLADAASVHQCYFYTLRHKVLTPRFMFLSSSSEHGI